MPPLKRPKDAMNNALKVLSRVTNVRVTDRSAAGLRHAIVNLLKVYPTKSCASNQCTSGSSER